MKRLTEREQGLLRDIARQGDDSAGVAPSDAARVTKFLQHGLVEATKVHPVLVRVTDKGRELVKQKPMSRIAELVRNAPVDVVIAAFKAGALWRAVPSGLTEDVQSAALRWANELD